MVISSQQKRIGVRWLAAVLCALPASLTAAVPTVDNAALYYYQAFLRCPSLDSIPDNLVSGGLRGTRCADDLREYFEDHSECRDVIELVKAASRVRSCKWGIPNLQGSSIMGYVVGPMRTVTFLLTADAQILAADGDHKAAFDRMLTLRRFAADLGDPNIGYLLATQAERLAVVSIGHMLEATPADPALLTWLGDELAFEPLTCEWFSWLLRTECERTLCLARADDTLLPRVRRVVPDAGTPTYRANVEALKDVDDEELMRRIQESYAQFMGNVLEILGSDLPYNEAYAKLDRLEKEREEEARENPAVIDGWTEGIPNQYRDVFTQKARLNALRAAVEVYAVKAETGTLPKTLPHGLPKDPFCDEDFEYALTEEGFVLRAPAETIERQGPTEYHFKVQ